MKSNDPIINTQNYIREITSRLNVMSKMLEYIDTGYIYKNEYGDAIDTFDRAKEIATSTYEYHRKIVIEMVDDLIDDKKLKKEN